MMRPPTFRRRLTVSMALLAVGVLACASAAIYLAVRHAMRATLDETLLAIARTEVASALDQPGGRVHVHEEGWAPITLPSGAGYEKFAVIKGEMRQVIAQTSNLTGDPRLVTEARRETNGLAGKASFGTVWRGAATLRAVYYPLRDTSGQALVAVVAVPTAPLVHALDTLLVGLVGVLLLGGAAAAAVASRVAAYLTRPLERIAVAARAIDDGDLAARIPEVSPDVELREMTALLNAMLARLQAALQTQRRLVADASHELRSPLTNLRGAVEVALRRPRDAETYRETLQAAAAEIERLCRLVEALLTLSRADAGQLGPGDAACDVARLADAAVDAQAARAATRGVVLDLEAPRPLPVRGDADRLRAVIDNLLDNAVRHAPPGTHVRIVAARENGDAVLRVSDAGAGLSAAEQAHIFERFYRADAARTRDAGGAGLGLAIVKAIVEAHGGRVAVASTAGAGATFSVRLPVAEGLAPCGPPVQASN